MDEQKYAQIFDKFVKDNSIIFNKSEFYLPLGEYLQYFQQKHNNGIPFLYFPSHHCYDPQLVIDNYVDNIVYSCFFSAGGGRQLASMVQLSPTVHLFMSYFGHKIAGKVMVSWELWSQKGSTFLEILDKHDKYKYLNESKAAGFGGLIQQGAAFDFAK